MPGFPIVLELSGRLVVVIGLGEVGRRKALGLAEAGANVLAVDPAGSDRVFPANIAIRVEPYRDDHLEGAVLAFAAATPEVNRQVVADARRRNLLINAASEPESGDFAVPATWRSGPIVLAVSTSGAGPALSATLRDRAADSIGTPAAELAELLIELRPMALAMVPNNRARRQLLRRWSDPEWLDRITREGPDSVRIAFLALLHRAVEE